MKSPRWPPRGPKPDLRRASVQPSGDQTALSTSTGAGVHFARAKERTYAGTMIRQPARRQARKLARRKSHPFVPRLIASRRSASMAAKQ